MSYKPKTPFNVPMLLQVPTITRSKGVPVKTYPENGELMYGSFKTYGGTEKNVNGVYTIEDTAVIESWYRPDITSECRIKLENGAVYEIINTPENIEMRNQFVKFKVRRIVGGL